MHSWPPLAVVAELLLEEVLEALGEVAESFFISEKSLNEKKLPEPVLEGREAVGEYELSEKPPIEPVLLEVGEGVVGYTSMLLLISRLLGAVC